jgi:ATP sulfurylase
VSTRRDAQTIFYSLQSDNVIQIIQVLKSIYCPELDTKTES